MLKYNLLKILLSLVLLLTPISVLAQEKGSISGKIVEEETGDALMGVNVYLKGTKLGGRTDVKGRYKVKNIPAGNYNLLFSYIGHKPVEIKNVSVAPGEVKKFDIVLSVKSALKEEVVVTARAVTNTEAVLLKNRQKAESFQDAISSEDITRGGSSDASDAVKKITGATTVDGKHLYIRGLGERYSTVQLNGSNLPSADPDKKSVHLDLFPAKLIDNIVTLKTATPDQPGDFTGGAMNITTKAYPDNFKLGFSVSSSYNFVTTGQSMLSNPVNSSNWLGTMNNKLEVPKLIKTNTIPDITETRSKAKDMQSAVLLDELSKSFNTAFSPVNKTAPVNQAFSTFIGNEYQLFKKPLGYMASFSYARDFSANRQSRIGNYSQPSGGSKQLESEYTANVNEATDEIAWGAIGNVAYDIADNSRVSMNFMYNKSLESRAVYQDGYRQYYQTYMETRILSNIERTLSSYQLKGEHSFRSLMNSKLDWQASVSNNVQYQPNFSTFDNEYEDVQQNGQTVRLYNMPKGDNNALPSRYYRDLSENLTSALFNYEIPLNNLINTPLKFKTGFLYNGTSRVFSERRYVYQQDLENLVYNGNPDQYMKENTGISEANSQKYFNYFGNYIQDRTQASGSYDGSEKIMAGYGMIDWYIIKNFRIVTGVRYETTNMNTVSKDSARPQGLIDEQDVLPSINMVYQLSSEMNLRLAFGKTLARPTLREIAPYDSYLPIEHRTYIGNGGLQRTLINNYDMRWEWFPESGEIMSVGGFYKSFTNPIELVIVNANNNVQPQNVKTAFLYGAEFEFRKKLGSWIDALDDFQLGMNLTLVHSQVDIADYELQTRRAFDPNSSSTRQLQGQSPYVLNLDLTYVNYESGTDANLYYNIFGQRLQEVGDGSPDYFEYPKPELTFVVSQKLLHNFKIRLKFENILDSRTLIASRFLGEQYVRREYRSGREITVSVYYDID